MQELELRIHGNEIDVQFAAGLTVSRDLHQNRKELPLQTLYLGGGTPSLLGMDELRYIVRQIGKYFDLSNLREFTLEANPEDVNIDMVKGWRSLGVNRVSLGIQSFDDRNLLRMNRAHNADQAREALKCLQDGGFKSLSADLIYGFPDRSVEEFAADLQELMSWGLPHFSSYQLTVEPRTALSHQINEDKVRMMPEELVVEQMMHLYQVSAKGGYKAYEISNFALPGHEAVHNSRYWSGYAYWGLGPSAHSYDGIRSRSWNVAHNTRYVADIQSGILPATVEVLTDDQRFNEAILIGLRLMDGLNWQDLEHAHGAERVQSMWPKIASMPQDWFEPACHGDNQRPLRLSMAGRAVADFIAVELFADS